MFSEHTCIAVGLDQQRLIGFAVRPFHAGRANRHSRDCNPDRIGLLLEQSFYVGGWHVTFDHVLADLGAMAGGVAFRHAIPRPGSVDSRSVVSDDVKARLFQVLDPLHAATAARTLPDFDFRQSVCYHVTGRKDHQCPRK